MKSTIAAALVINLCGTSVLSFSPPSTLRSKRVSSASYMFFADTAAENEPPAVQIVPVVGSESSIANVANFMVDAFWLQSPQQLVAGDSSEISDAAKSSLINIQADDLMGKYGERMGARKLEAVVLAALEGGDTSGELSTTENVQGMVTIEVRLFDMQKDILSADESERMLTQAVATLGPKQRREYKGASVIDIANNLLPADISAVVSLSNLCVSPSARRKGVAAKLCSEAERVAKEELGFEDIFLRVETANEAAKRLYEEKLGYECVSETDAATALRVDADSGSFVEIESDIVVLKKKL